MMNGIGLLQSNRYRDFWQRLKEQARWTIASFYDTPTYHLDFQIARRRLHTVIWLLIFAAFAAFIGLLFLRFEVQWVWLAWAAYIFGIFCIFLKPVSGLYLILFFSLIGDGVLMPGYPFNKNFSSPESIFYLNDEFILSALELYLIVTIFSWLLRGIARKNINFRWGPLGWIILIFFLSIFFGLAYGLSNEGDLNIALWEARPIFYLPVIYFLGVNLLNEHSQINTLIWAAMLALFVQGVVGTWAFFTTYNGTLENVESIMEHSSSIHINTMLVLILAVWLYRGSWTKRLLLPLMALPVLFTYLANQRRASFVALGIGVLLFLVAFYRHNRRLFKILAPFVITAGILYLAAFWNNDSILGIPAQGFRTAFRSTAGTSDYTSNLYRLIENVNTTFTIRRNMLLGVGFGNKFLILVPMPDISFFEWWEYITHNSILWIWIKAGLPGFVALLTMIGSAIMVGTDIYDRLPGGDDKAIGLTMVLYLVMHFIYAYVDMSWDIQSMVYVGTAMGALVALGKGMSESETVREPGSLAAHAGSRVAIKADS